MYQRPKWSYLYISLALEFYLRVYFSCECPPNCVLSPFSLMPFISESSIILTFYSHLFQDHYLMIVLFQVWIFYFHSAQSEMRAQNPGLQDPGHKIQQSASGEPELSIQDPKNQDPGHKTLDPSTRDPTKKHPGTRYPEHNTQDSRPQDPQPRIQDLISLRQFSNIYPDMF